MTDRSIHRKTDWSPEDRARHQAMREQFQRERPSLDDLIASGDYLGPIPQGVYLSLLQTLAALRQAREEAHLSLRDVEERSGIDPAALSRLENGHQLNPTLDTLFRYAQAVRKRIRFVVEDEPETQEPEAAACP